ncbi:Tad domain-containing protein [Ramlibacter sp.]|uniref:Tad domain-containing protein n=1 Tax=Ramlibacter sp. TaxID=1917967 RepID=UPI002D27C1E0|nr:Tad domain-containing protein [Ramlibacter sp.]HYD77928.1 Tad domain-containing protein [Ramlibacter sp.]
MIITVCLFLLFLLGFMGFALDLSRLFVVKTELQTAMDACALSAAQELDGLAGSIARSREAGETAANLNRVNLQSSAWVGTFTGDDVQVLTDSLNPATSDAEATYVRCEHTEPSVRLWLLHALGAFYDGNTTRFPPTHDVFASALATRMHAQSTCPLPLALRPKADGAGPPHYGYTPGEWITLLVCPGCGGNGYIGWANFNGSSSAADTRAYVEGRRCDIATGAELATPGVEASVAEAWNARFGIYRGSAGPEDPYMQPDYTGYIYTSTNWPSGRDALRGVTPAGAHPTAENFETKRRQFASCADTGTNMNGPNGCRTISGLSINSFNSVAVPGEGALDGHFQYGQSRRIALVPISVDYPGGHIDDWACMLMLQPMSLPPANVQLEYIGNASDLGSPCTTSGLPGGVAGPRVPVLVR